MSHAIYIIIILVCLFGALEYGETVHENERVLHNGSGDLFIPLTIGAAADSCKEGSSLSVAPATDEVLSHCDAWPVVRRVGLSHNKTLFVYCHEDGKGWLLENKDEIPVNKLVWVMILNPRQSTK